jgi:hypothetical protein
MILFNKTPSRNIATRKNAIRILATRILATRKVQQGEHL